MSCEQLCLRPALGLDHECLESNQPACWCCSTSWSVWALRFWLRGLHEGSCFGVLLAMLSPVHGFGYLLDSILCGAAVPGWLPCRVCGVEWLACLALIGPTNVSQCKDRTNWADSVRHSTVIAGCRCSSLNDPGLLCALQHRSQQDGNTTRTSYRRLQNSHRSSLPRSVVRHHLQLIRRRQFQRLLNMQLRQQCLHTSVGDRINQQHVITPSARPPAYPTRHNSSSGSNGRAQPLQATSSVAEGPTTISGQTSVLSAQPNSLGQRPAPRRPAPALSQTVLTMDSIARATNQEQEV